MKRTGASAVFTTLAEDGLIAFERLPGAEEAGEAWATRVAAAPIPSVGAGAVDVLGCGDALLAAATLALAGGGTRTQAAYLGNLAAGVHVGRFGNGPIRREDVARLASRLDRDTLAAVRVDAASACPARVAV
jgi:D-beta-D-heptose 7-phosphate kinase/D-beta-D-heptose 1-phosphate adenosyltransferase